MNISPSVTSWLLRRAQQAKARTPPDFIVGKDNPEGAYLERWYITPWRRWREAAERNPTRANRIKAWLAQRLPNLYLHRFLRDDDDRALHDHPSWAISLILDGAYREHTIDAGGIHRRRIYSAGTLRFLSSRLVHRIELLPWWWMADDFDAAMSAPHVESREKGECWTLFLFGPAKRQWGFHCPQRGWVHWRDFTAAGAPGEVGKGCDA